MHSSTSCSLPKEIAEEIAREVAHFSASQQAFFAAWKRGVSIAGVGYFGEGARADLDRAVSVWDLCPKISLIEDIIGTLSSGEKKFIAALVSFYNADDGQRLFTRAGIRGFCDLAVLDYKRRAVIAELILNYLGW